MSLANGKETTGICCMCGIIGVPLLSHYFCSDDWVVALVFYLVCSGIVIIITTFDND